MRIAVISVALAIVACNETTGSQSNEDNRIHAELATSGGSHIAPIEHYPSLIQVERLKQGLGAAEPTKAPRPLSNPTMLLIKHFEGWSSKSYNDSAGYCTIGYGHLIALKECERLSRGQLGEFVNPISLNRGEEVLEADTRAARAAVQRLVAVPLNDQEFGALSTFVFNLGEQNFSNSTLRRMVNLQRKKDAASQFGLWIRAKDKIEQGLVIRRKCEASLYSGLLQLNAKGQFVRSGCGYMGVVGPGEEAIDIYEGEE